MGGASGFGFQLTQPPEEVELNLVMNIFRSLLSGYNAMKQTPPAQR